MSLGQVDEALASVLTDVRSDSPPATRGRRNVQNSSSSVSLRGLVHSGDIPMSPKREGLSPRDRKELKALLDALGDASPDDSAARKARTRASPSRADLETRYQNYVRNTPKSYERSSTKPDMTSEYLKFLVDSASSEQKLRSLSPTPRQPVAVLPRARSRSRSPYSRASTPHEELEHLDRTIDNMVQIQKTTSEEVALLRSETSGARREARRKELEAMELESKVISLEGELQRTKERAVMAEMRANEMESLATAKLEADSVVEMNIKNNMSRLAGLEEREMKILEKEREWIEKEKAMREEHEEIVYELKKEFNSLESDVRSKAKRELKDLAVDRETEYSQKLAQYRSESAKQITDYTERLEQARKRILELEGQLASIDRAHEARKDKVLQQSLLNIRLHGLHRAMNQWKELIGNSRSLRHRLALITVRWQRGGKWRGFQEWTLLLKSRRSRYQKTLDDAKRSVRRMGMFKQAVAYSTWKAFAVKLKSDREFLTHMAKRWRHRNVLGAWTTWSAMYMVAAEARRERRKVGRTAAARIKMGKVAVSFLSWKGRAVTRKNVRRRTRGIFRRWCNAAMVPAFNTWATATTAIRTKRDRAKRSVRKWLYQAKARVWASWASVVLDRKRQREDDRRKRRTARVVAAKAFRMQESRALNRWKENIEIMNHQRAVVMKAGSHWRGRGVLKGWNKWKTTTSDRIRHRVIYRRMLGRWANREVTAAWQQWSFLIEQSRARARRVERARQLHGKLVTRWMQLELFKCINSWRAICVTKRKYRNIYLRWKHRGAATGMLSWQHFTKERVRAGVIMRQQVSRWQHARETVAWNSWKGVLSAIKAKREKISRGGKVFGQVTMKWINREYVAGFNGWFAYVRSRRTLRKISGRWRNRRVWAAVNQWSSLVKDAKAKRVAMKRMLGRWKHQEQWHAMLQWRLVVKSQRDKRERKIREENKLKRREYVFGVLLKRWKNRRLNLGLNAWKHFKQQQAALRNIGRRIQNRGLWLGFSSWKSAVTSAIQARVKINHATRHWLARHLAAGWAGWMELMSEARRRHEAEEKHAAVLERKAGKVALKWRGALYLTAMNQWKAMWRAKKKMSSIYLRWLHRDLARGWTTWHTFHAELRRTQVSMMRTVSRWRQQELASALRQWIIIHERILLRRIAAQAEADEEARRQHKVRVTLRRMGEIRSVQAVNAWKYFVSNRRTLRRIARRVINRKKWAGWSQWSWVASERIRIRLSMEKLARRMLSRSIYGAWARWLQVVADINVAREECRKKEAYRLRVQGKVARRWNNAICNRAMNQWQGYHRAIARLRQLYVRWDNRSLWKGFSSWKETVDRLTYTRSAINKMYQRMTKRALWSGLLQWMSIVRDIRDAREAVENDRKRRMKTQAKIARRWVNAGMYSAMAQWKAITSAKVRLRKIAGRWTHRELGRGWESWIGYTTRRRYTRATMYKMAMRWTQASLWSVYNKWSSYMAHAKEVRMAREQDRRRRVVCMRKISQRWKNAREGSAMDAWKELVMSVKRRRGIFKKMMNHREWTAFSAWHQFLKGRRNARGIIKKIGMRIVQRALWRGFSQWNSIREAVLAIRLRKERQNRKCAVAYESVVKRWVMARILAGWNTWYHEYKQKKHMQTLMRRWIHRFVYAGFSSWSSYTEACRIARIRMRKTVARWGLRALAGGWNGWQEYLSYAHVYNKNQRRLQATYGKVARRWILSQLHRVVLTWKWRVHLKVLYTKLSKRIAHRDLWKGYSTWCDFIVQRAQKRASVQKSLSRMLNQRVWGAWGAWLDSVEEARLAGAARIERQRKYRCIAQRWSRTEEHMAMNAWKHYVHVRGLFRRIQYRWINRHLWAGWNTWASIVAEIIRLRAAALKVVSRCQHRKAWGAFNEWVSAVDLVHSLQDEKYARKNLLSRIERRGRLVQLDVAYKRWKSRASEEKNRRAFLSGVVKKMRQAKKWKGMNQWKEVAHEAVRRRGLLRKVHGRWVRTALARGFNKWNHEVRWHEYQLEQKALGIQATMDWATIVAGKTIRAWRNVCEKRARLRKISKRWTNREKWRGFNTWNILVSRMVLVKRLLNKGLGRWKQRAIGRAFNLWSEGVYQARADQGDRKNNYLIGNLMHTGVNKNLKLWAFRSWERRLAFRHRMSGIIRRISQRGKWTGLYTWKDGVIHERQRRGKARKVVLHWTHTAMARGWNVWAGIIHTKHSARQTRDRLIANGNKVARRIKFGRTASAFAAWTELHYDALRVRRHLENITKRWMNRELDLGFSAWESAVAEKRARVARLTRGIGRWSHRATGRAFDTWATTVLELMDKRRNKEKWNSFWGTVKVRGDIRGLAQGFNKWRTEAEDMQLRRNGLQNFARRWRVRSMLKALLVWRDGLWLKNLMTNTLELSGQYRVRATE